MYRLLMLSLRKIASSSGAVMMTGMPASVSCPVVSRATAMETTSGTARSVGVRVYISGLDSTTVSIMHTMEIILYSHRLWVVVNPKRYWSWYIWLSPLQGFCCKCHIGIYWNERGDHRCGWERVFTRDPGSAHCFTDSELWYNVYSIGPPSMLYNITVRVLEFNGILKNEEGTAIRADWRPISTFHLTPSQPLGRSNKGQVLS